MSTINCQTSLPSNPGVPEDVPEDIPEDNQEDNQEDVPEDDQNTPEAVQEDNPKEFLDACEEDFEKARGLIPGNVSERTLRYAMQKACLRGKLETMKWLREEHGVQLDPDNFIISYACYGGHIAAVEQLIEAYGITAEKIKAVGALESAVFFKHIDLAEWLVSRYYSKITILDAQKLTEEVCKRWDRKMGDFLTKLFKEANVSMCLLEKRGPVLLACVNNYVEALNWLAEHAAIESGDISDQALELAKEYGNVEVLSWAEKNFGRKPNPV